MKKTVYAVAAFIVLFTVALCASDANADISLGLTGGTINAEGLVTQRLGWTNHRWYSRIERFGGSKFNDVWAVSAGRRVYISEWRARPYMELGVSYSDRLLLRQDKALVSEELTFELVIGGSYVLSPVSQIEIAWVHNSTAGRSSSNSGIDRVFLGYTWKF